MPRNFHGLSETLWWIISPSAVFAEIQDMLNRFLYGIQYQCLYMDLFAISLIFPLPI